ncbi:MAG: hypothetical protein FWF45_06250 [Coriobacteriia bacterium]|nr:hypothetical protein [Coriobacteriia bacterium]
MMTDTPKQTDTGEAPHPVKKPKLYLIDIENLANGATSLQSVIFLRETIMKCIPVELDDVVVIGTGFYFIASIVKDVWPQAQCIIREGNDGADHALLRELCLRDLSCFSGVVIASGDHIFAEEVARLLLEGFSVTVVSNKRNASHLLQKTGAQMIGIGDENQASHIISFGIPIPQLKPGQLRREAKKQAGNKHSRVNQRPILKSPLEEYWDDYGDEEQLE